MNWKSCSLALLLLAGCARSEDASVVADMNELQAVERVRAPADDDQEIAIGGWTQTLQDEHEALEFGPVGTPPLFSLRCDARRSLYLQRHGAVTTGDLPVMLVSIGSETRRLAVTNAGGTPPTLRASLPPSDPLVATLAGAPSQITVRVGDAVPLTMPASPEIGAFLSRCASGERAEGEAEAAPANAQLPAGDAAAGAPAAVEQ